MACAQAGGPAYGLGFIAIQQYGKEFLKTKEGVARKPVRLLYNGNNQCAALNSASLNARLKSASLNSLGSGASQPFTTQHSPLTIRHSPLTSNH